MKTKETSTRQEALAWWNNLTKNQQYELCVKQSNVDDLLVDRQLSSLTGREIEEIWLIETQNHTNDSMGKSFISSIESQNTIKPNQKQFKQFD